MVFSEEGVVKKTDLCCVLFQDSVSCHLHCGGQLPARSAEIHLIGRPINVISSSTCKCLRVLDNEVALTCSKLYLLIRRYNFEDISAIVLSVPAQEHDYFFRHPFDTVFTRVTIITTHTTNKQTNVYVLHTRNTNTEKTDKGYGPEEA